MHETCVIITRYSGKGVFIRMSLTFILGASGAGKTEWLYKKILETAETRPERRVFVIVPEQFSLQTMKDLIVRSRTKSMSNIEVLSFLRLSYRIFEELGLEPGELLSDVGKSLLVKRVTGRLAGELRAFAANVKKAGFIDEMKSLISEFYQYGITPEALSAMVAMAEDEPELHRKLKDIALVYQGFAESIEGKYLATETISDVLAKVIGESALVKNCDVFFDGFTGFTPSQYGLLEKLLQHAGESYMTLTTDPVISGNSGAEHGLFGLTMRTKEVVTRLAKNAGCEVGEVRLCEDGKLPRFADNQALAVLERGLFRYPVPAKGSCDGKVVFYAKMNRKEEAAFVAADIAKTVRCEGTRYGKIAVVTGDVEGYGELLLSECRKAGIPAFLDHKRKLYHNPCIGLIRAVLQNALTGFSYDAVFRYLKCGLTEFTTEEVSLLENYCLACGIRGGRMWKSKWKWSYRTAREVNLEYLNGLRERVYEELGTVGDALLAAKTAGERTRVLYEFLDRLCVEDKLRAMEEEFEQKGDAVRAAEYRQVYRKVMDILDRFAELLDEEEVPLREYIELMETVLKECKVGFVPPSTDCVMIGDITRTRLSDIDVLYLAGVNEGVTPGVSGEGGLLSETEREFLKTRSVELAPTRKETAYMEQFYLYSMLTKPRKKLVLTCSRLSNEGAVLQLSRFTGRIAEVFTDFSVKDKADTYEDVLQNDGGYNYFLDGIREFVHTGEMKDTMVWELYRRNLILDGEKTRRLLKTACFGNPTGSLSEAAAKRLYGTILYGSVTRLEKYAACAFAHFMQYGLSLEERAQYKVAAPEMGNLYHMALEVFTRKVKEKGLSWHTLTESEEEVLCTESLKEAVGTFENGVFDDTKRNTYLVTKAKRVLLKTVKMLREQIKGSLFEPERCEAVFEHTAKYVALRGKIDRYDLCQNGNKWYLRVIDYKSGTKKFDLTELYYGLQVQLEVYLAAALREAGRENETEIVPAGMFYFHVDDPFIDREKYSEVEVKMNFRPDGLFNRDLSAVTALDTSLAAANGGLKPSEKSTLIQAETDKEGGLKESAHGINGEDFDRLTEYVYEKLEQEAEEILSGEISANPYRYKKNNPCGYCAYKHVCGFDNRLPEFSYRDLKKMKKEELWEEFRKECHE